MTSTTGWSRWFAWRPVKTDQGRQWLCVLERRRVCVPEYLWHRELCFWQYRVTQAWWRRFLR